MLLPTKLFALIAGVEASIVSTLKRGPGSFKPVVGGHGNRGDLWTCAQALAIVVSRGLKRRGVSRKFCEAILQEFWATSQEALEAAFAEGRTHLLIVNTEALPRLLSLDSIQNPGDLDLRKLGRMGLE